MGLAAMMVAALAASPAFAHAKLVATMPADGSLVAAPTELRLRFDEPVEVKLSGVDLSDSAGNAIATGAAAADPADPPTVVIPVSIPLKAGRYKAHWHAVSDDMHRVEGDFAFEVKP
jgi:methionine-rich copper-binding protein CopC